METLIERRYRIYDDQVKQARKRAAVPQFWVRDSPGQHDKGAAFVSLVIELIICLVLLPVLIPVALYASGKWIVSKLRT